jgi:uracil-DNA glycosylase family 4
VSSALARHCAEVSGCTACPRLVRFLDEARHRYPGYHAAPVPSFGARTPTLLVVGLAPGLHGANRTGRPFTGDHAGVLLYRTLHRYGFASAAVSRDAADDLVLHGCRITNAVRCVPPQNKPDGDEIRNCNRHLAREFAALPSVRAVLALGAVAHRAVLMAHGLRPSAHVFAHGARHELAPGRVLFDSYHCSRYNTQTGRLTDAAFEQVFDAITREFAPPDV